MSGTDAARVEILGAGVIGLAVADELRRRGHEVRVVDPAPARGASWAAAGMLSPAAEVWHDEPALLDLGRRSQASWPSWGDRLGVPLTRGGTLLVGLDADDLRDVKRQATLVRSLGGRVEDLDGARVRALEPTLAGRVLGGVLLPDDHSVDPRRVLAALLDRVPVQRDPGPAGWAEVTVLATGASLPSAYAARLGPGLVRGVRGEVLRARSDDPPTRPVRGWVRGRPVYVVPRADGEVVIGATSEEHDQPPVVTLGGVHRLLDAARELVPGLDRAELLEALARDRPGTANGLPLVGPTHDPRVVLATGHFRHGVLLAPLTAELVADHLESGRVDPATDPRRLLEDR
ncbi:Glycine oxidase [Nocardioides dokdonensis FR1436]|uniref:glycine oxidase n=1 Tax=Nocardioides dokdonensis FR1436 TaxID=1300347 RepID=A0A1A9GLZ6_9ACTN|nr:glycine oxidase ThiO [Nocardioides dokdonensis]ANH38475.1 Glycine oxidase [Nocardioides dokdonensis FR1436]